MPLFDTAVLRASEIVRQRQMLIRIHIFFLNVNSTEHCILCRNFDTS